MDGDKLTHLGITDDVVLLSESPQELQIMVEETENYQYYSIIAPKVLRPNTRYHVSVTLFNTTSPTQVAVQLTGNVRVSSETSVGSDQTGLITFEIGNWTAGNYKLEVVGNGGLNFRNRTDIQFVAQSYNVLIQTDKSIYRGSQKVQFRAIILDKGLWPRKAFVEMLIKDADNNTVKHYTGLNPRLGLVSEELQLPDKPVLGDWKIYVMVSGQEYTKKFTVAEYVLPGYYVKVKLSPSFVTYDNSRVTATISAVYTYGKPVKGTVTINVVPKYRTSAISVRPLDSFQTILDNLMLKLMYVASLNLIEDNLKREIEFIAIVEEELTGRRFNGTNSIFIYNDPIKMELIKTAPSFKPGLSYKAFLKVSRQDDTPLNAGNGVLDLKYSYNYKPGSEKSTSYPIPQNGIIELDFFPPLIKDTVTIFTKALFNGKEYELSYVEKAYSTSNTYMQISLNTRNPQVISRGNILRARSMFPPGGNSHSFRIRMTENMAPMVRIVVSFSRPDGEIVADGLSLELDKLFENTVSLSARPGQARPGENVDISIRTTPNSMVGLMGIDQNNLLLKPGNDITKNDVIKSMESFDSGKRDSDQETILELPVRSGRSFFYPGSLAAASVFDDAGVVVLTNGIVNRFDQKSKWKTEEIFTDIILFSDSRSAPPTESVYDYKIVQFGSIRPPEAPEDPRTPQIDIDLPPTWLWYNRTAGADGVVSIKRSLPSTMTSWIISAFAISPVNGLALAPNSAKVTVFKAFFVKLVLPYSVIIGETVSVQAVIFNYNKRAVEAEVTLENKGGFEFVTVDDNEAIRRSKRSRKVVVVPAQEGKATYFMIKPNKIGFVNIKVFAGSALSGDGTEQKLRVVPPGAPQRFNKAFLIDRKSSFGGAFTTEVDLEIPRTVIRGSEKIEVSAFADFMGPVINNLGDLLRIPHGCGEQNMINFVPNILVLNYLKANNRLTPALYNKAIPNIGTGYQRQLTFKHKDGSFSAFGSNDKSGSTWVTSYVMKSFRQAKEHIPDMIDNDVIKKGMEWLGKQLNYNGTFAERGVVINKQMQGSINQGLPLTAFVLIALHENREFYSSIQGLTEIIRQAHSVLERKYQNIEDTNILAIVAYALQLLDSPSKDGAFHRLADRARFQDDKMYWSSELPTPNNPEEVFHLPHSSDIEMTSYGLMTYILRGDISTSLKIAKWLVEQRNSIGGFTSTPDTVIAIQALTLLANSLNVRGSNVEITVSYDAKSKPGKPTDNNTYTDRKKIVVNDQNAFISQKRVLPSTVRKIKISAEGRGLPYVQVSWEFYLEVSAPNPSFNLNPLVDKVSTKGYLQVSSCISYIPKGESGMTVMEYYAPSGYVIDRGSLSSIMHEDGVKRVESGEENTMVSIYFDKIGKEAVCPTVSSHRVYRVANQKTKPVIVFDYYDRTKISRMFYQPYVTKKEEICDGRECDQSSNSINEANIDTTNKLNNSSSSNCSSYSAIFSVIFAILLVR
ncbi:CD109 antigen [Nymphon striatum]|nr:CD109 antigen [Nymphon striatum]